MSFNTYTHLFYGYVYNTKTVINALTKLAKAIDRESAESNLNVRFKNHDEFSTWSQIHRGDHLVIRRIAIDAYNTITQKYDENTGHAKKPEIIRHPGQVFYCRGNFITSELCIMLYWRLGGKDTFEDGGLQLPVGEFDETTRLTELQWTDVNACVTLLTMFMSKQFTSGKHDSFFAWSTNSDDRDEKVYITSRNLFLLDSSDMEVMVNHFKETSSLDMSRLGYALSSFNHLRLKSGPIRLNFLQYHT